MLKFYRVGMFPGQQHKRLVKIKLTRSFKSVREYDVNAAKTFWFGEFGLPSQRFCLVFQCASRRLCESGKLFYSLLTIVLWATSSASSEDTPSTHKIGRISAEVFSRRMTMNLVCCSVAVRRFRKKPEVAWKRGLRALRPLRRLVVKTNGCRKKFQDLASKYWSGQIDTRKKNGSLKICRLKVNQVKF